MIGRLRTRIAIYRPKTVGDDLGGQVITWPLYKICWAKINPMSPRETVADGRASIILSYKIIIRFRDDFPERARLIWGAKTLRVITASDPDGRRERLHLICEEEQQ